MEIFLNTDSLNFIDRLDRYSREFFFEEIKKATLAVDNKGILPVCDGHYLVNWESDSKRIYITNISKKKSLYEKMSAVFDEFFPL